MTTPRAAADAARPLTVAVIIPTLDRAELLGRCLAGVLAGEHRPDQIVVVDQSRDELTADVARSAAGGAPITYLHRATAAVSAARNAGTAAAQTDLVAFIDDDCVPDVGWLAALVTGYRDQAAVEVVAAVAGAVLPLPAAGGVAVSSRIGSAKRVFRATGCELETGIWAPWDVGTGGNLLVPRRLLEDVAGFDVGLGPGTPTSAGEDIDLLYRLARRGSLVYEPAARVRHPMTTRRRRLASRRRYGRGMAAMLAGALQAGDPAARTLTRLYLRHQVADAVRGGAWRPLESALTLAGALPRLLAVARAWT